MAKAPKEIREDLPSYAEHDLDPTGVIAHHYGFIPIYTPHITTADHLKAKSLKEEAIHPLQIEERISLLRFWTESPLSEVSQPALLYFKKPFPGSGQKKKVDTEMCGLEIINSPRAVAEALILKTAWAILSDENHNDMYVDINSVGDKESFAKFERDLSTYFKKNIHLLSTADRQKFKNNIYEVVQTSDPALESFQANAPKSLNTLSENSRDHFKEVLEFLESFNIPYRIAHHLIPTKGHASHTIFEIRKISQSKKGEVSELLAYGGRYNYLAKKSGYKKEIPSCGITVTYRKKTSEKRTLIGKIDKPQFYVVQLGNHAKLKLLNIIELLRKEKIIVYHSLTKERIAGQLSSAEYLDVSHILIMGQKEALENTIVIRAVESREQETVSVDELVKYLKGLLK